MYYVENILKHDKDNCPTSHLLSHTVFIISLKILKLLAWAHLAMLTTYLVFYVIF